MSYPLAGAPEIPKLSGVPMTVQQLIAEARKLPPEAFDELVESLLGVASEPDPEVDEAWKAEIRRRVAEIESGRVQLIPGDEVMAEVRKIVGR